MDRWLLVVLLATLVFAEGPGIEHYFRNCRRRRPDFDACVQKGLNSVRHLFKKGIPEYGVLPFDPFFAAEVPQRRGGPSLSYNLMLRDVSERGWSDSLVTSFKSDLANNRIVYSQFFPEKSLDGKYEIQGLVFQYPMNNKGKWNMTLYNYSQTTTITRKSRSITNSTQPTYKVKVHVDEIGDMDLKISNLFGGRVIMERMMSRMIDTTWRLGLPVVRPLINDLVSTAFTGIFNEDFQNFPFAKIFPE